MVCGAALIGERDAGFYAAAVWPLPDVRQPGRCDAGAMSKTEEMTAWRVC
jgi:hypothetical protein